MTHRRCASGIACLLLAFPWAGHAQRVTDSAGVRVVHYPAPAGLSAETAFDRPQLTLPDTQCELNGVGQLALQATGNIVVPNAGDSQICLFNGKGSLIRKIGRSGAGPGEFRSLSAVHVVRGDSILVVDGALRRVSLFSPSGDLARTVPFAAPDTALGSFMFAMPLADGSVVAGFSEFKRGVPQPKAVMFQQQLVQWGPSGKFLGKFGSFPIGEHSIQETTPQRGRVGYFDLAFGRRFSAAPFADGFVGGDGTDFSVSEYGASGRLRSIHRVARDRDPVSRADIEAYRAASLENTRPANMDFEQRILERMPFPERYPAFRRVLGDDAARIWVQLYPKQGETSSRWLLLDSKRGATQSLRFPDRFRLLAIRGGMACGVARNDVDLERVQCFAAPR